MSTIKRHKYLSREQYTRLRSVAAGLDPTTWMIVDAALQTGLRVGELAMLTRADIDLDLRIIRVHRLKKKGGPMPDNVPMSESLHSHLREYCAWLSRQSNPYNPHVPLFLGRRGPMTRRGLQQTWTKALKHAGLPPLSIHSARHTFAVAVRQETGDIVIVQKLLGHEDPKTTANMYAEVPWEEREAAVNKIFS